MNELRIFLSSTQGDLGDARQSILRFLEVLHSDLISMEVFGSDESKPKDFSLKQVRSCNLYIGVYAERYGTIDKETDLSITELEYREALKMLKAGRLVGLLIYIIDSQARWPLNLIDRDPKSTQKLRGLKKQLTRRHTVTFFKSSEELPFLILRDVVRKIGLGMKQSFRAKAKQKLLTMNTLDRPIGMEYYREELNPLFHGREEESDKLVGQVVRYPMSLLIGASGIGKTSLLTAGLLPRLRKLGWRTALIRPLTEPMENLRRSVWDQLLEGVPPREFDFVAAVHSAAIAYEPAHVLIIIDQFEDILGVKASTDVESLTRALLNLHGSAESNLRFLVCYRGDVEAQIGATWQRVSGSVEGLPRSYLGPLTKSGCENALRANLRALGISLGEHLAGKAGQFIAQIVEDLASESFLDGYSGVYPPFLQMVISRIFADVDEKGNYTEVAYSSAGQCRRIIADFLISQLRYLGKNEQKGREVLIALVSSHGMKTQKTVEEISTETLQDRNEVEMSLRSLTDLRMVRAVKNHFEIVHDFLAKTIVAELVSTEEREAKKFKDLLASRAAAYPDTHAILTKAEHIYIYKYRNKILCTERELQLLLASYLAGNGPVRYWLRSYSEERVIAWVRSLLSEDDEETRLNACRFLIRSGEQIPLGEVAELFSDYKLKSELGEFILKLAGRDDIPFLIRLHRKKAEEVVHASEKALVRLVSLSDEEILSQLARSTSQSSRHLFERLSLKYAQELRLKDVRNMWKTKEHWKRLLSIYALGKRGTKEDLEQLQGLLEERKVSRTCKAAAMKSIVRLCSRFGRVDMVRSLLSSRNIRVVAASLEALEEPFPGLKINEVLVHYQRLPWKTARAVRCLASEKDLPVLKRKLKRITLRPSARDIVLAVCENGRENEFEFLLKLFLGCKHRIDFWNTPVVFRAVAELAGRKHLSRLNAIMRSREFWEYHRRDARPSQQMPVAEFDNLYFIKRLIGATYANVAGRRQFKKLRELLKHDYWTIWDAAADAVVKLAKISDLSQFIEDAISFRTHRDGILRVLRDLDERFYSFE